MPIGPFSTGLNTTLSPWLVPIDGFTQIENAHIHNGAVEKRQGLRHIGFNAHHPTTLAANGDVISSITKANPAVVTTTGNHNFSNGDQIVIIGGDMIEVENLRFTVANKTASTFELSGIDSTAYTTYTTGARVYLSPSVQIMGLTSFIDNSNVETMIGWDTKRAFLWNYTREGFEPLDSNNSNPADYLNGGTSDFVNFVQWNSASQGNVLYFTNGLVQASSKNGIWTYDPAASPVITSFVPDLNNSGGNNFIFGAKGIDVFKGRMVLFGTYEGASAGAATFYPNRVAWCQISNPGQAGAITTEWDRTERGKGGYADPATQDNYISHQKLQNEIIVFMSNSVWSLRYQADPIEPFKWQKINNYFSSRAAQASVGYDRYAMSLGNRGIFLTDGVQAQRADDNIERFVETEISHTNFAQVFAHRDYKNQRAIILYPGGTSTTNSKALVRDDETGAYSTYELALSCLGDGTNPNNDELQLDDFPSSDDANPLDLPVTALDAGELKWTDLWADLNYETLIGGDYSGLIYQLNFGDNDNGSNIKMTLETGEWNPFRDQNISAKLEYVDFFVDSEINTKMTVSFYKDSDYYPYQIKEIDLLPNIRETATINDITPLSPSTSGVTVTAPNHGLADNDEIYIYNVEGMTQINGGPWTVSSSADDTFVIAEDASSFGTYTLGGVITRNPYDGRRIYKRIVSGATGNAHKLRIEIDGDDDPMILHRIIPKFQPAEGYQL